MFGTRRLHKNSDDGMAMVTVMIVSAIAMVLITAMLAQGVHVLDQTTFDRKWNRALQAAEAGVEETVSALIEDQSITGLAPGSGEFVTTVEHDTPSLGYKLIKSTGYSPNKADPSARVRKLEVLYGPEPSFEYALFSDSTLDLKNQNNNCTDGDAYAKATITVDKACVLGSVRSATGAVIFSNAAEIKQQADPITGELTGGDVYSGGLGPSGAEWGIQFDNGVVVEGDVHAQRDLCPTPPDTTKYKIVGRTASGQTGEIWGDAYSPSTIFASFPKGGIGHQFTCEEADAPEAMPQFQESQIATAYPTAVPYTDADDFSLWAAANDDKLKGVFWVDDPGGTIKFGNNATVTSTFVLITNSYIEIPNSFDVKVADADTEYVHLISLNADQSTPAISVNNTFAVSPDGEGELAPVLVYSPGLVDIKNTANVNGAVYGGRMLVRNNLNVTYDDRIKRVLGFGGQHYVRVTWKETTGKA